MSTTSTRDADILLHERLECQVVADPRLIYTPASTDRSLPAVMLTAHQDVVPADASDWTQPPFDGVIEGGFISDRGAMTDTVYRLLPIAVTAEDVPRFHGIDQRIAIAGATPTPFQFTPG